MKSFDVYGIGNALVDIEYRVAPDDLSTLGVDKGVMTLVESDHQRAMMHELDGREVNRGAGGSAANTIIALSQLGGRGFYSCRVADDELGHHYVDDLEANEVATNARECTDIGDTGRCLVMVTEDADRTMCTYLGITGELGRDAIVESALRESEYLYIEGYLASAPTARDAVAHARSIAREAGVKTALSLSDPNVVHLFREGIDEFIGEGVDLLFSNEDEAKGLAGNSDLSTAVDNLRRLAGRFVVTRGAAPTLVYDGNGVMEIPVAPVTPLDTLGAGDMFAGAFLYGLSCGRDLDQAANLANHCAGRLIVEYGPRLPRRAMRELLEEFTTPA